MTKAPLSQRALKGLADFLRLQAAGGILLIAAAALALVCANTALQPLYERFREPSVHVINDGLMAVFFLLVALEIKRESLTGQLAGRDGLVLPMVCACAGVAVPCLMFAAINHGDADAMRGWAVPTATDIAFALGVLSLLGSRVPNVT